MKLLILDAGGMLGHQLCRMLSARFDIWATLRGEPREIERYGIIPQERTIGQVDVQDITSLRRALDTVNQMQCPTALELSNSVMKPSKPFHLFTLTNYFHTN